MASAPSVSSVWQMLQEQAPCSAALFASAGDAALDSQTLLWPGGVFELVGEAGTGKTAACMTAAVHTAAGQQHAWWLACEGPFPVQRLRQIAETRSTVATHACAGRKRARAEVATVDDLCGHVHCARVHNLDQLLGLASQQLSTHMRTTGNPGLVVVDGLPALVAAEYPANQRAGAVARGKFLAALGAALQALATRHRVPVLVTNHVSSAMAESSHAHGVPRLKPALGGVWSHYISARYALTRGVTGLSCPDDHAHVHDVACSRAWPTLSSGGMPVPVGRPVSSLYLRTAGGGTVAGRRLFWVVMSPTTPLQSWYISITACGVELGEPHVASSSCSSIAGTSEADFAYMS